MRGLLLLLAFCVALHGLSAQSKPIVEFTEYDLDNGLHVILQPNNSHPLVSIVVLYRVGSKNEDPQRTGFAHFFEHLLFEGSENIGRGEFQNYVQMAGGRANAATNQDETHYFETLPSNQLEMGLWLESERMLHAKVDSVGVITQRLVVKEEKRQTEDNQPYAGVGKSIFQAVFSGTPYAWLVIGSMEHLDKATLSDFENFYQQFYVPENAVLSIAGDIEVDRARELVAKYFAGINRKPMVPIQCPVWKEIRSEQEVRDTLYDANIIIPLISQAYRIPGMGHPDEGPLRVLASILGEGRDSRLGKALLREKHGAADANASTQALQNAGIFFITARPSDPEVTLEDLERRIDKEIDSLRRYPPSKVEMEGIKNRFESALVDQCRYVENTAQLLARSYVYYGDTGRINKLTDRFKAITGEDIRRVANKYLVKTNKVTTWDIPKSPPTAVDPGVD